MGVFYDLLVGSLTEKPVGRPGSVKSCFYLANLMACLLKTAAL